MLDVYLEEEYIIIDVDFYIGFELGIVWGCDLSYEYVKINVCYWM